MPQALGGRTEAENLWLACSLCNDHKGDRVAAMDPETGQVVLLFNPRRQVWEERFLWNEERDRLLARTAVGRATLLALDMNRPSLVRARRLWALAGWHPPNDIATPSR